MENKKILFVSYKLCDGGAENVLAKVANHLSYNGNNITILLYQRSDHEYFVDDSVNVISLGTAASKGENNVSRTINRVRAIRSIVKKEQPSVIIPFLDSMVRESVLATVGLSSKVIATVRNSPFNTPSGEFARKIRNLFCMLSSAVWVQNRDQKAYFNKVIQKKTFIVGNPVNEEFLNTKKVYQNKVLKFVTCGRLHEQKNHKFLINAFAEVVQLYPDITLSIYGVGPMEADLKCYISSLGMDDNIFLMGRTNDVCHTLLEYDCFILSSDFEGMPNALMEAMAVGLPCISTDCPTGPSDLIDQKGNGLLVPIGSVDKMKEAICFVVENVDQAESMGIEAKKKMQQEFSEEQIVSQLLERLRNL